MIATDTAPQIAPPLSRLARFKAILGGSAGNLVEWYDWFAYSSFALYFAPAFFPKGDRTAQLLQTAAVFAVGFFARPVGAWAMGLYADRAGRRAALTLSVAMMSFGAFLIAIIPAQAQIGALAPLALLAARLLQGLSVGGEYGASATYLSEMAGRKRRAFWTSFQFVTLIAGQLIALGVLLTLQQSLSAQALTAWGWRIPFAIGGALAIVVFWIRTGLNESQAWRPPPKEGRAHTMMLFLHYPRETWICLALTGASSAAFYTYTTYMQKFLVNTSGFTAAAATEITAAGLVVFMAMQPAYGWLADRIGRKPLLIWAFGGLALFSYPIMATLAHTRDFLPALLLQLAALCFFSGFSAVNSVVKAELFPAHVRALGVALPYALANAACGGTAEYAALWFKQSGAENGFFLYISALSAIAAIVSIFMRETKHTSLILED